MPESLAYLEPAGGGRGDMVLLPEGDRHTYRSDLRTLETGLYEIDYAVKKGEKGVRVYDVHYVNQATPATPRRPTVLFDLIREITGFGDKIVSQLKGGLRAEEPPERAEQAIRKITDRDWLETVRGIGPSYSEDLSEKFESLAPAEMDVYAAFRQHGLPYRRGNAREQWACALMSDSVEELDAFRENPYHLMTIDDEARRTVREAAQSYSELTVMGYSLSWIDKHVSDAWLNSPERAEAHLEAATEEVFQEGHTVARPEQIANQMRRSGFETIDTGDYSQTRVDAHLVQELARESDRLQSERYITAEGTYEEGFTTEFRKHQARQYSTILGQMMGFDVPFSPWERRKMESRAMDADFDLDDTQETAIRNALNYRVSAITGAAGSGKTSTVQQFLRGAGLLMKGKREGRAMTEDYKRPPFCIYVLAPSGKAAEQARRGLTVTMPNGREVQPDPINQEEMPHGKPSEDGHIQAGTIHSFLGYRGVGQWNVPDPHPALVVVDESSMKGLETAYYLLRFFDKLATRELPGMLLMLGDNNQLEPVAPGAPFRDSLGEVGDAIIPSTTLSHIHRQGKRSAVLEASRRVLDGKLPPVPQEIERSNMTSDFFWHRYPNHQPAAVDYLDATARRAQNQGISCRAEDVQMILPLRNPSSIEPEAYCVRSVNKDLQSAFAQRRGESIGAYPAVPLHRPGGQYTVWFAEGDRVVHNGENGYAAESGTVMRGTIGRIVSADPEKEEIRVRYSQGEAIYSEPEEISQIGLAWAITGHVAQGSEYDVCSVALPKRGGDPLMTRSWLYTALTRSVKYMDLMGTVGRVKQCAETASGRDRQTILSRAPGI